MAEAADMCASSFVRHCHSHRLLPIICNAICTDRNAKLRQICTAYLFQVHVQLRLLGRDVIRKAWETSTNLSASADSGELGQARL